MDTNRHELRLKDEVFQIVGSALEVLNSLGHGLTEKPYERSLAVEFGLRGISYNLQSRFTVIYKETNVGDFIPDIIAYEKIIVEVKCIDRITNVERGQVINYLKITGLSVGVILNFRHAKLEWERIVL
jgi:GxxExxY protein